MSKRASKQIRKELKAEGITSKMPGFRDIYQGLKRGIASQLFRVRRIERFRAELLAKQAIAQKAAGETSPS